MAGMATAVEATAVTRRAAPDRAVTGSATGISMGTVTAVTLLSALGRAVINSATGISTGINTGMGTRMATGMATTTITNLCTATLVLARIAATTPRLSAIKTPTGFLFGTNSRTRRARVLALTEWWAEQIH